jgi:hypothetical protein
LGQTRGIDRHVRAVEHEAVPYDEPLHSSIA